MMITRARPSEEPCPACPFRGLAGTEPTCPSCGTDLSVLRRVQHLPAAILEDGILLASGGDPGGSRMAFISAAAFDQTRAAAMAQLLGWQAECPDFLCRLRHRGDRGSVVLVRQRGGMSSPQWRCHWCGRAFSGDRARLRFRSQSPGGSAAVASAGPPDPRVFERNVDGGRVHFGRVRPPSLRTRVFELGGEGVSWAAPRLTRLCSRWLRFPQRLTPPPPDGNGRP
jgi:hypothetical protein